MKLKYICPFCFTQHAINDVAFACDSRMVCPQEPDDRMQNYMHLASPPMGPHHFRAPEPTSGFSLRKVIMPAQATCDLCHQVSHTRVCPDCHNMLPATIEGNEDMIISLIGGPGSGKSTYVGVLIHEMMKHLMGPFNGTFQLYGTQDQNEYRDRFENYLYPSSGQSQPVPKTVAHLTGSSINANRPILGMLNIESKRLLGTTIKPMTLVFFDSAGEDWRNPDTVNTVARYAAHSSGIIFLLDPLANRTVRRTINDDAAIRGSIGSDYDPEYDPARIIDRVAGLVRRENNIKPGKPINIPVAAAFSKLDVLEDHGILPPGSALAQPSPHAQCGQFMEADSTAVNNEMRGLLGAWDATDFIQILDMNYTVNHCFAFSAYGREPAVNGAIATPTPKRIEDALLWLLHLNKVL